MGCLWDAQHLSKSTNHGSRGWSNKPSEPWFVGARICHKYSFLKEGNCFLENDLSNAQECDKFNFRLLHNEMEVLLFLFFLPSLKRRVLLTI